MGAATSHPVVNGRAAGSGMRPCVLLKFGEMALKGRNQWRFVERLEGNVRRAVRGSGPVELRRRAGVLALFGQGDPTDLVERVRGVPGISLLHPALALPRSADAAVFAAVELLRGSDARSFAIRPRRRDKRFPVSSQEIAVRAGDAVVRELGLDVDLSNPDAEVFIEVDRGEIFAYTERVRGAGGLPVGISGRALVLLSGGIDSPVAAHRAMRRGLRCDFIHFSGQPFTGPESVYKAYGHVARLDRLQGDSRLFIVPLGRAQRSLATAGAGKLQVMAQRRLMVRVAELVAIRERDAALVTGDSLGQVASQTLANMAAVEAVSGTPILRPLVAFYKSEIVEEAQALGTYEISTLPDEDCCRLFAPRMAETRADARALDRLEGLVEARELAEKLADEAELVRPRLEEAPAKHPARPGAHEALPANHPALP